MLAHMEQRDVLADGEIADARIRLHDEALGKYPRETDAAGRVQGVAELLLQERSPHAPGKENAD